MTSGALAHKLFRQYVGRTLSVAVVVVVAVYFLHVPALTIAVAVVAVPIAAWWLYYVLNGPARRGGRSR
jgi:uncharacterized membrane protein